MFLFREHVVQMSRNGRTSNIVVETFDHAFDHTLVSFLSKVEVSSHRVCLVFCHVEPRTREFLTKSN